MKVHTKLRASWQHETTGSGPLTNVSLFLHILYQDQSRIKGCPKEHSHKRWEARKGQEVLVMGSVREAVT